MMDILILVVVIPLIVAIAKGRGASPWIAGIVSLGGFIVIRQLTVLLWGWPDGLLAAMVSGYVWLALVAAFYRFMVGHGRPQPTGIWVCKKCSYTNKVYALTCGACGEPWRQESGA